MTVVLWKNPQGVLEEAAIRVGAALVLPTGKRGELVAGAWGSEAGKGREAASEGVLPVSK